MQLHIDNLLRLARERISDGLHLHAERLVTSPKIFLFQGQKLDMRETGWVLWQVAPLNQLCLILASAQQSPDVTDNVVPDPDHEYDEANEDDQEEAARDKERLDLDSIKIERLTSSNTTVPHDGALFLLHHPDVASAQMALQDIETMRRIVGLVDAAPIVVCEGSSVLLLAATGFLDGCEAVVDPKFAPQARRHFPTVMWKVDSPLARHGKFVTVTKLHDATRAFAPTVLALQASGAEPAGSTAASDEALETLAPIEEVSLAGVCCALQS